MTTLDKQMYHLTIRRQFTTIQPLGRPATPGRGDAIAIGVEFLTPVDSRPGLKHGMVYLIFVLPLNLKVVDKERTLEGVARKYNADVWIRRGNRLLIGKHIGGPNATKLISELLQKGIRRAC